MRQPRKFTTSTYTLISKTFIQMLPITGEKCGGAPSCLNRIYCSRGLTSGRSSISIFLTAKLPKYGNDYFSIETSISSKSDPIRYQQIIQILIFHIVYWFWVHLMFLHDQNKLIWFKDFHYIFRIYDMRYDLYIFIIF